MNIQEHANRILRLLAVSKNVLLVGPPATGKSKLIQTVSEYFYGTPAPALKPASNVPIPATGRKIEPWMPSPSRANRRIFPITFHQGTKHRQFVSGISPELKPGSPPGFRASNGLLTEANQYAIHTPGAALLSIDEINRGPAVSIFGDTLTSIEPDKRLADDDKPISSSAPFYAYDLKTGEPSPQGLSPHVYILATMNEADTSVEPLDVAFLRRFSVYRLNPEISTARAFLGLPATAGAPVAAAPLTTTILYESLVAAWSAVNTRISLGRSPAFQIGHGILMRLPPPGDLEAGTSYVLDAWLRIEAHIDELFFGNDSAKAIVFNAGHGKGYALKESYFGEQPVARLVRPSPSTPLEVYTVLESVAGSEPKLKL